MKSRHNLSNSKAPRPRPKRGRLFRRVRRQRVRYITVLPSLITILNGVFGFTALVLASKAVKTEPGAWSWFAVAGYMVLVAMIADMLDGRLARMSQSTSSFGGQLDSLCDMISFGIAPAFLMLQLVESKLELSRVICEGFLHRFIWLAALAYIACAAVRLARFNVENDENEMAHMSFVGLPSPGAAGVIVSLVIFQQEEIPSFDLLVYLLPFVTLGMAILMVSRIRYPHILNVYLAGKKPFSYLIRVMFLLGLAMWNLQTALVLVFGGFAAGSLVRWVYAKVVSARGRAVLPTPELAAPIPSQAAVSTESPRPGTHP